jgi:RimJ/RimL family protein N-acetyltransferase
MIATPRLLLREWREEDRAPFAALNADPRVMEFFPTTLDRAQSDGVVAHIGAHFDLYHFGLWAIEVPGVADFVGFCGLVTVRFAAHFTPAIEIGWRLAHAHWGRGYATEAARAALDDGFARIGLREIVAFAVVANQRSRRVMERIGMTHAPADDFDHPFIPAQHPLCHHVLYRKSAPV